MLSFEAGQGSIAIKLCWQLVQVRSPKGNAAQGQLVQEMNCQYLHRWSVYASVLPAIKIYQAELELIYRADLPVASWAFFPLKHTKQFAGFLPTRKLCSTHNQHIISIPLPPSFCKKLERSWTCMISIKASEAIQEGRRRLQLGLSHN